MRSAQHTFTILYIWNEHSEKKYDDWANQTLDMMTLKRSVNPDTQVGGEHRTVFKSEFLCTKISSLKRCFNVPYIKTRFNLRRTEKRVLKYSGGQFFRFFGFK